MRPPGRSCPSGRSRGERQGYGTVLAVGATPGEAYQGVDWGEAWPFHRESMIAYGEQRYADALEAVRVALEHMPDHAGLDYNYACFATLAGDTGDETFATFDGPSSCSRGSARTRAETATSPPWATTRGSRRLFAERPLVRLVLHEEEAALGSRQALK